MSAPKTLEQLAQSAYAAYCKKARDTGVHGQRDGHLSWHQLDHGSKDCWAAAAYQLWAEMAAQQGRNYAESV